MNLQQFDQQWSHQYEHVAGIDEVGRGPLAGPVCAAAVILPTDFHDPRINDSKKISPALREKLSSIIKNASVAYSITTVDAEVIDTINILNATRLAMWQAVYNLKLQPHFLLIDGMENTFSPSIPGQKIIKGDNLSQSIAAASIIAKVHRDQIMLGYDEAFPLYGFARHKGYGTAYHIQAIELNGLCTIHRRSFCNRFKQEP